MLPNVFYGVIPQMCCEKSVAVTRSVTPKLSDALISTPATNAKIST